ncbi:MAG: hypothetical protein ACI9JM_002818, partial [Halioglobus sp.]
LEAAKTKWAFRAIIRHEKSILFRKATGGQ